MSISVVQAVLIGIVYYLGINGTPWLTLLGSTIIQKPLVSGVLVGFILGDPVQGAIIGAAIQLPFIAYISAGGAPPTDPGLAGTLGTALAMVAGVKPTAAIALAVPIGLLGTIIWVIHMTVDVFFVHMIDKAAEEGNMKKAKFLHIVPPQVFAFIIGCIPVALGCYFGSDVVTNIIHALSGRPLQALEVIGGLLPAIGIAMNLRDSLAIRTAPIVILLGKIVSPFVWLLSASTNLVSRLTPMQFDDADEEMSRDEIAYMNLRAISKPGILLWYVLGFIIAVYLNLDTMPIAIIAGIVAYIYTGVVALAEEKQTAAATAGADSFDDDFDDDFE